MKRGDKGREDSQEAGQDRSQEEGLAWPTQHRKRGRKEVETVEQGGGQVRGQGWGNRACASCRQMVNFFFLDSAPMTRHYFFLATSSSEN